MKHYKRLLHHSTTICGKSAFDHECTTLVSNVTCTRCLELLSTDAKKEYDSWGERRKYVSDTPIIDSDDTTYRHHWENSDNSRDDDSAQDRDTGGGGDFSGGGSTESWSDSSSND